MELNMEEIKKIEKKLEVVFEELGFEKATVNGTLFYLHCTSYYKITYVEGLKSFVIECADDYSAVEKNVFEDGDL
jgi:hypothetical protein